MTKKIGELNRKFGMDGILEFIEKNELACASIGNKFAKCAIYLHGAHVASFIPEGEQDILWMSRESYFDTDRPIRGGIPVCWPWFGAHPTDRYKPSHGFARLAEWSVAKTEMLDDGRTQITLELSSDKQTLQIWPYDFKIWNIITVGKQLEVELVTVNLDHSPIEISSALHSYFNISNIADIAVSGLANGHYIDTIDEHKEKIQDGKITFDSELDRVYINTEDPCIISDSGLSREICIEKNGSRSTVVWNPWIDKARDMPDFGNDEYKTMACVETTNALNDKITIYPDGKHSLKAILGLKGN